MSQHLPQRALPKRSMSLSVPSDCNKPGMGKAKHAKNIPSGLGVEHLKAGLSVVAALGDGILGVPGLKGAAMIALQIVGVAELARSNKEDCLDIAQQASLLLMSLANTVKEKTMEIDSQFTEYVQHFEKDLHEMHDTVRALGSRAWYSQTLHASEDQQLIQKCQDIINHSSQLFQVQLQILGHQDLNEIKEDMVSIKKELSSGKHAKSLFFTSNNLFLTSALPPCPALFVGRDELVVKAVNIITSSPGANIAILGPGGMGKTALSLSILHDKGSQEMFNDQRYFIPCEALNSAELLLSGIFQVLGSSGLETDSGIDRATPDPLLTLQHFLAACGKLMLVLDNFETPWNESVSMQAVQDILKRVASVDTVTLIITMRGINSPSGIKWASLLPLAGLQPLTPNAAIEMFLEASQSTVTPEAQSDLDLLLKELEYVPLAITLISYLGKHQSPSLLLKRWNKEKTNLLKTHDNQHECLTSIHISVELSLKSFHISDNSETIRLLALISCLPDGVPQWENVLDEMCPAYQNLYDAVGKLCSASLIYANETGALKMLSPIRHYIASNYSNLCEVDMKTLINFYMSNVLKYKESGSPSLKQDLISAVNNIRHLFQLELHKNPSKGLVKAALGYSQFLNGKVPPVLGLVEAIVAAVGQMNLEDILADCLNHYGSIYTSQKNYLLALAKYEAAYIQFCSINNKKAMAYCLCDIGYCLQMMGHFSEALAKLRSAELLFNELCNMSGQALCWLYYSYIHYAEDNYMEAKNEIILAHALYSEIDNQDGVAYTLLFLGKILKFLNQDKEARITLEQAYEVSKQIDHLGSMATSLQYLAELFITEDKHDEATSKIEAAYALYETIGDIGGMGDCLEDQAQILVAKGKYIQAEEKRSQASEIYSKIGSQYGIADSFLSLGYIMHMAGKYKQAAEKFEAAYALFSTLSNQYGMAESLCMHGIMLRDDEQYFDARSKLESAMVLYKKINYDYGVAECTKSISMVCYKQKDYTQARSLLSVALDMYSKMEDKSSMAMCISQMGDILDAEEDYVEAKQEFTKAYNLYSQLDNKSGLAECLSKLSRTLKNEEKYTQAKEKIKSAHKLYKQEAKQVDMANCQYVLGDILYAEDKFQEARNAFQEAYDLYLKAGEIQYKIQCLYMICDTWDQEGEFEEAVKSLTLAYTYLVGNSTKESDIAEYLQKFAGILKQQKKYAEAKEKLESALSIYKVIKDEESVAECLCTLAEVYEGETNMKDARANYEAALALYTKLDNEESMAQCLQDLGSLLVTDQKPSEAQDKFKAAYDIYSELDDEEGMDICQDLLKTLNS